MIRRLAFFSLVSLFTGMLALTACTPMSNRSYVERHPEYRGVNRVAVLIQRWPCYRQLPGHGEMQLEFITKSTPFLNAWKPAERLPLRAVDVEDIDDAMMGALLLETLRDKGHTPFIAEVISPRQEMVADIMAKYLLVDPQIDAFLFCFYSPTLFFSHAARTPLDRGNRSYGLAEIIHALVPHGNKVIWAGPRAERAPSDSISHAFVYLSLTMFKAADRQVLWTVTDSQVGGKLRGLVWDCPPEPTEEDYWADAALIRRLMMNNVRCRLRRLVPQAF
jgi:hypothetical protein